MTDAQREYCDVCRQLVADIGPWCWLYITTSYCQPLRRIRRAIYKADAVGDGSMVNALCQYIRVRTHENFVP